MKLCSILFKSNYLFVLFFSFTLLSSAQNLTITGSMTNKTGEALLGVTITTISSLEVVKY